MQRKTGERVFVSWRGKMRYCDKQNTFEMFCCITWRQDIWKYQNLMVYNLGKGLVLSQTYHSRFISQMMHKQQLAFVHNLLQEVTQSRT